MLPLLGSLAGSNAARIAALVPTIVANIPDDPRLVEPLWRCLAAPEIEERQACRTIVERLLTIVMDPDGLHELEKQEPYTRPFLSESVRRQAYPFADGFSATSNLVTLLAWADHLNVAPLKLNRFFEAKAADRLAQVETDKRRTISFSLFLPARILASVGTLLSLVTAIIVLFSDWRVLLRPFGWWSLLLSLGTALVPFGTFLFLADNDILYISGGEDDAHFIYFLGELFDFGSETTFWIWILFLAGPLSYVVAIAPLATLSVPGYLAAAVLGSMIVFYLPMFDICARTTRFYLYRPNPYIDMYDDPSSRHWLQPRIAEPAETSLMSTAALSANR